MKTELITLKDPEATQEVHDVTLFCGFRFFKVANSPEDFINRYNPDEIAEPLTSYKKDGSWRLIYTQPDGLYFRQPVYKKGRVTIDVLDEVEAS